MITRIVLLGLIVISIVSAGCKGTATIEDIEGWIRAGQFSKVQDFCASTENPSELKIQTIRKLVEYGQTTEVQNVLEAVPDREAFVAQLVEALTAELSGDEATVQVEAKDALFILLMYVDDAKKDVVLKSIADWAFGGLNGDTPAAELTQRVQATRMFGQLNRMGKHGIPVAAWLVGYGVETQSLSGYLAEAKDPETQKTVIAAIKRLFAMKNLVIPWEILDISRAFAIPETIDFLVDVYLTESFPEAARSSALAAAQDLVYGVGGEHMASVHDNPDKKKIVLAALSKLMGADLATDRWDAADMMLHVGGVDTIDRIIGGLKADIGSYVRFTPEEELEMPDFVVISMCNKQLKSSTEKVRPVLEAWLTKGDAVQKAFSALCLKALASPASVDKLKPLVAGQESLEYLFFMTDERNSRRALILEEKIPELTIGLLAQNAIDGIGMLTRINAAVADKKMDTKEAELRTLSAVSVISFAGDAYTLAVEQSYQKKASRPGTEEPGEVPGGGGGGGDGGGATGGDATTGGGDGN